MSLYTKEVMEHFRHPKNMGVIEDAEGVGKVGNPSCGDVMYVYIKVEDDKIVDLKWETMGCAAAIATTSVMSTLATGMTIEEAEKISKSDIANGLGNLPPVKMHCSNLASDGLKAAIKDYREKTVA